MHGRIHTPDPVAASLLERVASTDLFSFAHRGKAYAFAVATTALCLAIRLGAMPWPGQRIMLLMFLIPVMASAYCGGLGPGLVSSALGALCVSYFLIPPILSFEVDTRVDVAQVGLLLLCGATLCLLIEALRRGRTRDRARIEQLLATERLLRDSVREAAELRAALDEHAIVAITDEHGVITHVNDRFCAISGYSREELLGQNHRLINSGYHAREFFQDFWRTIRAGKAWHGEVKNRAKDGSFYWVNTTVVPFPGPNGSPQRYIAIRADITARKQADEAVDRQRAELQILFDLNPAMIWFKDTLNNHVRVNQRAADAVGMPVSAIEGKPASAIYPEEAEGFYDDDLEVIRSRRAKIGIIEKIHDKDGRNLWIETNKVPYCDATGRVVGIVVTAQDITERHKSAEALRLSEERFRQLAENINEVFWVVDPADRRFLYVSPAYEAIWGRACASLYQRPEEWLDAIHAEDRDRVGAAHARVLAEPYDLTFRILRPDGDTRWIRDRGFPVRDPAGNIHRVVGTAEDVTSKRHLQEQLLQSQKMEAIGTLAGGIAHDFNNILGGIIGYAELARMRVGPNPQVREHLDAVLQAGRRAADLVRQILAFSRRQERRADTVQLRLLVAEALKLLRASIPATIEFDVRLAADAAPVRADPTQIHQVVLNLCANAEHAMRGRTGRLSVRLENFAVDEAFAAANPRLRPGPHVRLSVGDTGCGIPPDIQARIFEPFFTTKPPGEGSGLGLSVVHGVMESHSGITLVHSAPGEGARFELYFPARSAASPDSPAPRSAPPAGNGERILLVEDEALLAQMGRATLRELGYQATSCTHPAEALALFQERPLDFDLVLTDHTMPGMTGIDLAERIRAVRPGVPVILTTGYCTGDITGKAKAAGVDEVLFKPLEMASLGEALRRHLPPAGGA